MSLHRVNTIVMGLCANSLGRFPIITLRPYLPIRVDVLSFLNSTLALNDRQLLDTVRPAGKIINATDWLLSTKGFVASP